MGIRVLQRQILLADGFVGIGQGDLPVSKVVQTGQRLEVNFPEFLQQFQSDLAD